MAQNRDFRQNRAIREIGYQGKSMGSNINGFATRAKLAEMLGSQSALRFTRSPTLATFSERSLSG
jgi:hypothetical protein